MRERRSYWPLVAMLLIAACIGAVCQAAFDLSGPRIDVRVVQGEMQLPISQVPNLRVGDRLWLRPELPKGQSVHYLLIVAFLRGPTNPPPDNWFTKAETWTKDVREEGIHVTVPEGAEQALLFLAPVTGGDFSTLRNAVQGRPGAFVRAGQDLNQAALDRSRIDTYMAAVKDSSDPHELKDRSTLLARSLKLKLNQSCFEKPAEQQVPCLTQETRDMVLNDGHSESMVASITSGPSADLIGAVTSMPMAGGGFYYSYLGVFLDLAHLMDNLHTAQYQYIPALALPEKDWIDLKLNNPPSFHKPMSVMVATLPAVESPQLPPLHEVDPEEAYCMEKSPLVLPVEGAPLIFSTGFAHDFSLQLESRSGKTVNLPAIADAAKGGFVVDARSMKEGDFDSDVKGTLRGRWGFLPLVGPSYTLHNARSASWTISPDDRTALILGREDVIHLQSESVACVSGVEVKDHKGKTLAATWKASKPDELQVTVPLKDAAAGPVSIAVKQSGLSKPDKLTELTYATAARLDNFTIHLGDREGKLQGERLDEVELLKLDETEFAPAALTRNGQKDTLALASSEPAPLDTQLPAEKKQARALLKDGRVLEVDVTIEPPRPKVAMMSKVISTGDSGQAVIQLGNPDELPLDGKLSFVLESQIPAAFPRTEKIEIATEEDSTHVLLSIADGTLTLQDASTVLAVLEPLKSLGPSTFGALRFRAVDSSDAEGDWQPLANLVRLPDLQGIQCPGAKDPGQNCTLNGTNLFLLDSVSTNPQFADPVQVPSGYARSALQIPHPEGKLIYFKLRDDPSSINSAEVPMLPAQP